MPYDLSDGTGADKPAPIPVSLPTGRPSDVLRPAKPLPGTAGSQPPVPLLERPATPFDDAASGIFWFSLLITVLGLGYLLWGVWSGLLAEPNFSHSYAHADRVRIMGNLALVESIVRISMIVMLAVILFLFYDDESTGYILVVTALILDFGLPWLSQFFLGMTKSVPSHATNAVIPYLKAMAFFPGVPGLMLAVWDIIRRMLVGLQQAKIRKSSLRYGQNAINHQVKRRNVFLGPCWNLPYCRETIRTRCPVFIKRFKPCWQHKMGCMCEESIAVLATTADWKTAVAKAMAQLEHRPIPHEGNPITGLAAGAKIELSAAEKKQRCRECVIYNTHQEHKYKLLVTLLFAAIAGTIYLFNSYLIGQIGALFVFLNGTLGKFSLSNNGGAGIFTDDISGTVAWFVLAVLSILIFSKLLQLVEYCCFTIKI